MLVGQLLLFQVDQLAQTHFQDFVGLDARQRVGVGFATFQLELLEPFVAQCTLHHRCRTLDPHQSFFRFGLGSAVRESS